MTTTNDAEAITHDAFALLARYTNESLREDSDKDIRAGLLLLTALKVCAKTDEEWDARAAQIRNAPIDDVRRTLGACNAVVLEKDQ